MTCEAACSVLDERALSGAPAAPDTQLELDEHLAGCAACRAERESLVKLIVDLPATILTPEPPNALARARLLAGTRHGRALPTFAGAIARLFDLPRDKAHALLTKLDDPAAWKPGMVPGNSVRLVRPGARAGEQAVALLLRTAPGTVLPHHTHAGIERTFVLQGGFRDSAGREVWAGEQADMPGGSSHELLVLAPVDCIAAVLCHGGLALAR